MKSFQSKIQFFLLAVIISIIVSMFPGCSAGTNTGDVVCDYGTVLCDVSTTLCADIPGVPDEVCSYLNLACYNLNVICDLRDSTETVQYKTAVANLEKITAKLEAWKVTINKKE